MSHICQTFTIICRVGGTALWNVPESIGIISEPIYHESFTVSTSIHQKSRRL